MDTRVALSLISTQLIQDVETSPIGTTVDCVLIEEWELIHQLNYIAICGDWPSDTNPLRPAWINFEERSGRFTLSIPSHDYLLETVGLIYEVWRNRRENPNRGLPDLLSTALEDLARRWRSPGEPLKLARQMGLIGELLAVSDASEIVGHEAVESWDSDSRALYDITSEEWVIEAKATSSDPEHVWISDPHQLDFTIHKQIILAVTRLNRSREGRTMPQIVDEIISTMNPESQSKIRIMLITQGYAEELRTRFVSKWVIHGTRYIPITDETPVLPCSIFDGKPDQVDRIRYRLATADMDSVELSDCL